MGLFGFGKKKVEEAPPKPEFDEEGYKYVYDLQDIPPFYKYAELGDYRKFAYNYMAYDEDIKNGFTCEEDGQKYRLNEYYGTPTCRGVVRWFFKHSNSEDVNLDKNEDLIPDFCDFKDYLWKYGVATEFKALDDKSYWNNGVFDIVKFNYDWHFNSSASADYQQDRADKWEREDADRKAREAQEKAETEAKKTQQKIENLLICNTCKNKSKCAHIGQIWGNCRFL